MGSESQVTLYSIIAYVLFGVGFVVALALFFLFVFPNKASKQAPLFRKENAYVLNDNDKQYLQSISYDASKRVVLVRRKEGITKMSVSLVYEVGGKRKTELYSLDFTSGEIVELPFDGDSYYVIINSANGKGVKSAYKSNIDLVMMIVAAVVLAIFVAAGLYVYNMACVSLLTVSVDITPLIVVALGMPPLFTIPVGVALAFVAKALINKGGK